MKTIISLVIGIVGIGLIAGALLLFRPAATQSAQNEQLVPTPFGITPVPTSLRPAPTMAGGAEADAQEGQTNIRVSHFAEVTPTPTPTSINLVRQEDANVVQLFIQPQPAAQEVRLGNDQGDATFGLMTDSYVVWHFDCYQCNEQSPLQTGLYAYNVERSEQVVIAQEPGVQWDVEADGTWLLYVDYGVERKPINKLFAYNLSTSERVLLGDISFPEEFGFPAVEYYALQQGKAAWLERGSGAEPAVIHTYDLVAGSRNTFAIPGLSPDATYLGYPMIRSSGGTEPGKATA